MAIIALRQEIELFRSGELDEWGNPSLSDPVTLKARVDEGSFTTADVNTKKQGSVVVAEARILLDGIEQIDYGDEIAYTNELDLTIRRSPKRITIKRSMAGSPLLTEVLI